MVRAPSHGPQPVPVPVEPRPSVPVGGDSAGTTGNERSRVCKPSFKEAPGGTCGTIGR